MTQKFNHPGVYVSSAQLEFVRKKVQAHEQPWYDAYQQMNASKLADLARPSSPVAEVTSGSGDAGNPAPGWERQDALAAYTQALCWYLTEDHAHARKAIEIMDGWSAELIAHTGSSAPLQAGLAGATWARAAEIIRHTFPEPWSQLDRFKRMLRSVYLPMVLDHAPAYTKTYDGNWELAMAEAAVSIAVFLDDQSSYAKALDIFRKRVRAYIYLQADGSAPHPPVSGWAGNKTKIMQYWHNPVKLENGVSQETCRDFAHVGYGIASISHVAETARIQGDDLYADPDFKDRLRHALELHCAYANGVGGIEEITGDQDTDLRLGPVTEPGYNALKGRLGTPMDQTGIHTERHRPHGSNGIAVAWETLTHALNSH